METFHYLFLNLLLLFSFLAEASSRSGLLLAVPDSSGHSNGQETTKSDTEVYCDSWRLSVETNNAGKWKTIPSECQAYIMAYRRGKQYDSDSMVVASDALTFAKTISVSGDGKDAWVFDCEDTLLSGLGFYDVCGEGPFNQTCYDDWVVNYAGTSLPIPATKWLYEQLQEKGFSIFLITGRKENLRNATETTLLGAGYRSWTKLIMRDSANSGKTALVYKSSKRSELMSQGYKIHGSCGDQWSDLLGSPMATRSFKIPNPLFYTS